MAKHKKTFLKYTAEPQPTGCNFSRAAPMKMEQPAPSLFLTNGQKAP